MHKILHCKNVGQKRHANIVSLSLPDSLSVYRSRFDSLCKQKPLKKSF